MEEPQQKDVKTALCIQLDKEILRRSKIINDIRKKNDKNYDLWMPRFNLLFPFIPEAQFADNLDRIQEVLLQAFH
jgi:hypothetical protein